MADQPKNDDAKEEVSSGESSSAPKKDSARSAKGAERTKEERRAAKARARAERANEEAASRRRKERERRVGRSSGSRDRRNMWLIIASVVLLVASAALFMPPNEKINQGLDIQGGLSVVLSAQSTDGEEVTAEDMEKSRSIIESRVNALGASEATVQVQGTNQILVQIPGLTDSETALETIGKTGKLEFARADSFTDEADQQAIANGTYMTQETVTDDFGNTFVGQGMVYRSVEPGTYTPLITGENITRVTVDKASETGTDYAVNITLDAAGTEAFAQATRELAPDHGQIVIVLDGEIQSAPAVQAEITGGNVSITGNYTLEEAQALQTVLESGSLPVSFQYEQSQVVGPTLGQDALASGMLAAVLGLVVVVLYLLFFYRGMGVIAAVAMGAFAVLYLGVLALLSAFGLFSLSLAGLAGVVLTIGITADSSILALERFREEVRMGRSVRAASQTGVRHAIQTAIDADLVTIVSALTLFFLASASVKGFGLTLTLGIVCDIVLLFLLKAPLIRLLAPRSIAKHPGFWGLNDCHRAAEVYGELAESEGVSASAAMEGEGINAETAHSYIPDEGRRAKAKELSARLKGRFVAHDLNIVGARKILFSISAALIVLSIAVVGIKGLDFGIEFVGGTSATFHDTGDISIEQMRAAFNEEGEPDAIVQTTVTEGTPGFLVRTATTSSEDAMATAHAVASDLGVDASNVEISTIGPDWGASVIQSSAIAFGVSLILIIIYIAIRFEYKMGIMAVVALLHNLIIVVGVYALFGREVTPNTVAALLTILGYSLYDTMVVFHRINDNMKGSGVRCTFATMANHSLNQVIIRSFNTMFSSLIPVAAMLFFGGTTLGDFAFAMAVGLVTGAYSSIAIATPLFSLWKSREAHNVKLVKKFGPEIGVFTYAPEVRTAPAASTAEASSAGSGKSKAAAAPHGSSSAAGKSRRRKKR